MKNTRRCPKCGSSDILFVPGYAGAYGSGNNIKTGFTIFSAAKVERYVCGNGGSSAAWIRKEDTPSLKNNDTNV